jgi:ATP-dependent DNA helicase RecG
MEWPGIESRIQTGESDSIEFRRWDAFPGKVAETVAAFANTDGGVVLLGIADDGTLLGVREDPELVSERITSFLQSALSSPVPATIGRYSAPEGWIHWIEVRKQRGPDPLRYRGRVIVRRGRASDEPTPSELQNLYNTFGFVLTEEQVIPGATTASIDPDPFRDFLARQGLDLATDPQPEIVEDLRNRGVIDRDDGEDLATLYGLLCFGKDPQGFVPTSHAWIECVAYNGKDRADAVLLTGKARGRVDEQVERAIGWIGSFGATEQYGPLERTDRPIVPVRALREALVNAVAHRDYAILGSKSLLEVFLDRVVITSPGSLPNNLSESSVLAGGHPRSRNELIANFLLVRGFMERRGRGLPVIRREMRAFNGTEPLLESSREERFVRLTLLRDSERSKRSDDAR